MRILIIYDDTGRKSEVISDIIGEKTFADVVVKRRRLEEYYRDALQEAFTGLIWRKIQSVYEYSDLLKDLEVLYGTDIRVIHCFSNYLITDCEKVLLTYRKIEFIDENFGVISNNRAIAAMFPCVENYVTFCKTILSGKKAWDIIRAERNYMNIEGMVDIGLIHNFIQCITGNFDSRYFNSLKGNEYTLIKSSYNKKKIQAEYNFYHLLPEDMKFWFVMPFNYQEDEQSASYTMERFHMTDIAIKWVHGSMDDSEFEELMDKYFYFFRSRHIKECSEGEYQQISQKLYVEKIQERLEELKKLPEYEQIKKLLEASKNCDVDSLVLKYFDLKKKIEARVKYPRQLVIGHGDPCFANALYNKSTKTLKFIDPKGANTESELWTNEYYDLAKLSHSVCGRYDFFNNALYDIRIDTNFSYNLEIPFDNTKYIEIFRRKVEENGFDYLSVRIYEASLFLSMLPLHIDNPHKVFGFILNVNNILKEIEEVV